MVQVYMFTIKKIKPELVSFALIFLAVTKTKRGLTI